MTYLLDTSIIADLTSDSPNPSLITWVDSQPEEMFFISVATLAEIKNVVSQVRDESLKTQLDQWIINDLLVRFHDRISEIDVNVTLKLGEISAHFQSHNLSFNTLDAINLAIAIANDHVFVTNRVTEFEKSGARLFNPYQ